VVSHAELVEHVEDRLTQCQPLLSGIVSVLSPWVRAAFCLSLQSPYGRNVARCRTCQFPPMSIWPSLFCFTFLILSRYRWNLSSIGSGGSGSNRHSNKYIIMISPEITASEKCFQSCLPKSKVHHVLVLFLFLRLEGRKLAMHWKAAFQRYK